ncbi:MAG TPA: PAS domain S-box protein [Candidatus Hydrogenedentes bacterium]|nr:PAS domain S-box protein [Candidatus Hydrogenedentota bacterium]
MDRRGIVRTVSIGLLLAAYALFMAVAPLREIAAHLPYLPIVLSGLWWGRRSLAIAGIAVGMMFVAEALGWIMLDAWSLPGHAGGYLFVAWGVGVARERVRAARAAERASEDKYRQLVEKSLAGVFVYRDDRILYANSRFKDIVGFTLDELAGRTFWDFIHADDLPAVRERVEQRKQREASDLRYECRLNSRDGRVVWAEVVSSVMDYEGEAAVLVSVYDITERKENEEKQRELSKLARKQEEQLVHSTRLAEMGEMAAGVAHELNQPLTGIKNYARNATFMIEEGGANLDDVKENLRMIAAQVDRASKIINQMREMARRTERLFAPVDVNRTLRESVEFVMPQLKLSGVETVFDLAPDLPNIMGDRIRLEQVFLNLLTNARHAMEESPDRTLTIRTRHDPGARWPVVVEIADTGKGFAPDVAERLFTPFFTTKQTSHGTGLGLSISLGIVKDHQGMIEATGSEGKGAVFTVRLPVHDARDPDRE